MRIEIEPEIFALFPGYVRHVLVVSGADNEGEKAELAALLQMAQESIRKDESLADLKAHPRIASWRAAFEKFGVNPNQCPPSVANLIKRVRAGKALPYVNTLVAIFNVVSMNGILPAGGDDLDKVARGIRLGFADGRETYIPLGSPDEAEHPKPGEIILYDTGNESVFCRAWCWKNGDSSRIDASTKRVAINIDALPPVSGEDGLNAAEEAAELVRRFCRAEVSVHRISVENPGIEV